MPRGTGTTRVELVLGTGTVEALDGARGRVPRATFVKLVLEAALREAEGTLTVEQAGPVPVLTEAVQKRDPAVGVRPVAPPQAPVVQRGSPSPSLARFAQPAKQPRKRKA